AGDEDRPVAPANGIEPRVGVLPPTVEVTGDINGACTWSPDAKCRAAVNDGAAHGRSSEIGFWHVSAVTSTRRHIPRIVPQYSQISISYLAVNGLYRTSTQEPAECFLRNPHNQVRFYLLFRYMRALPPYWQRFWHIIDSRTGGTYGSDCNAELL